MLLRKRREVVKRGQKRGENLGGNKALTSNDGDELVPSGGVRAGVNEGAKGRSLAR